MSKSFQKVPLLARFVRLFRGGRRHKAFLDEPAESQITAGIVCFSGWISGPSPILALTLEIGDRSKAISTFHERTDVLDATGATHAVGWRLYAYISSRAPGADLKVRILFGGVCLLERTLICFGGERQQAFLDEPSGSRITPGVVCFSGRIAGPDPISALTLEIGDRSENILTFREWNDLLKTGASHAAYWNLYVYISSRPPDANSLKVRILVGGVSLFERTLICLPRGYAQRAMPLFFCMHIPKTAGTSLRMALDGQPERLRAVCVYPEDPFISATRCFELGTAAFDETDIVVGHFPYGFHAISRRPYRYITVVREPYSLLRSYYLYAKYVQKYIGVSSIYEAAEDRTVIEMDNILTRYFSNRLDCEPVTEADYVAAKRNIQKDFVYIGTTENMKECVQRISGIIGVDLPLLHINETTALSVEKIDLNELRSRLKNRVLFDLRIYEWIGKQFGTGL